MSQTDPLIIVTGATRGIGLSVTKILLTKFGVRVVGLSRSRTPALDELGRQFPSRLTIVQCDVTDEASTKAAIDNCQRIDGLILNAGTMVYGRIGAEHSTAVEWKRVFDINFFTLLHTVKSALPRLRESKGKIIFISSGAATGNMASWGAYNTSKAAMNSFCRTLASEEPDITSVAIRPGKVDTAMQQNLREKGLEHMDPKKHQEFVDAFHNGELVKPEDSGHVIAALSLKALPDYSGRFFSWNDPVLQDFRA